MIIWKIEWLSCISKFDRDCLAFATEPVMMSLSNAIDPESSAQTKLDEVEIKYGLLQVFAQLYNSFLQLH